MHPTFPPLPHPTRLVSENARAANASAAAAASKPDRPCIIIIRDPLLPRPLLPPSVWSPPIGFPDTDPFYLPRLRIGCPLPPFKLGRWERQSRKLAVAKESGEALGRVLQYVKGEEAAVRDGTMDQEVKLLQKLVDLA